MGGGGGEGRKVEGGKDALPEQNEKITALCLGHHNTMVKALDL